MTHSRKPPAPPCPSPHVCRVDPRRAPRGWRNVNPTEAEPQMWKRRHESHGPLRAGRAAAGQAGPPGGAPVKHTATPQMQAAASRTRGSDCHVPRSAHPPKRRPPAPVQKRAEPWAGTLRKLLPDQQHRSCPSGLKLQDGSLTENPLVTETALNPPPRGTTRGR